jgi:hypothetical protein
MTNARKAARIPMRFCASTDRGMVADRPKCRRAMGDGELERLTAGEERRS